jgi:hypothetical protein
MAELVELWRAGDVDAVMSVAVADAAVAHGVMLLAAASARRDVVEACVARTSARPWLAMAPVVCVECVPAVAAEQCSDDIHCTSDDSCELSAVHVACMKAPLAFVRWLWTEYRECADALRQKSVDHVRVLCVWCLH